MEEATDGDDKTKSSGGVDRMLREFFPDLDPEVVRRVLAIEETDAAGEEERS